MNTVIVSDSMQVNYHYYLLEPMGENFASDFNPELSPKEMLSLGVFGGKYLNDCKHEYPDDWFVGARLSPSIKDVGLNYFEIDASQPLKIWQQKCWIHSQDPRGWFQWYCRYYMGRRSDDDRRQIKRWKAFVRHVGAVKKNCERYDFSCRRKQRQALLHWAYDSRLF